MKGFEVGVAPTNRTTCRICKKRIVKGTLRLKANLGSGNYSRHYHAKCFVMNNGAEITELYELL